MFTKCDEVFFCPLFSLAIRENFSFFFYILLNNVYLGAIKDLGVAHIQDMRCRYMKCIIFEKQATGFGCGECKLNLNIFIGWLGYNRRRRRWPGVVNTHNLYEFQKFLLCDQTLVLYLFTCIQGMWCTARRQKINRTNDTTKNKQKTTIPSTHTLFYRLQFYKRYIIYLDSCCYL